jgi:hypothetical protein
VIITAEELISLLSAFEARGRAEVPPQTHGVTTTVTVEAVPAELVREVRQAIVTMRRVAQTPGIRRRAQGDCQSLEHRALRLEYVLKEAGK